MQQDEEKRLWIWWATIFLGLWLFVAPLVVNYGLSPAMPAGGRSLWLSLHARVVVQTWNDLICGALVALLGFRMLTPGRTKTRWAACFVGIWLQFAPFVFWAPSAFAYANDTLVGVLVIALTMLIPGMPGMVMPPDKESDLPPGWSYNPSSWPQRSIMIVLAFVGWMISRYLASYQLGYTTSVADPFFGESTRLVLTSQMSRNWPISDAALGAFAYTFEFLMGWMGSASRWRTMPWMVVFFGILVIPLGLVHVILVISQPVVVGHWCALCLLAAFVMLNMIPLAVDEVFAMAQFMRKSLKAGAPFWKTFWLGGTLPGVTHDGRSPDIASFPKQPWSVIRCAWWGFSSPWTLMLSSAIGVWLMAAPEILGAIKPAADVIHLAGALVVVTSVITMAELLRKGRYINVVLGLVLVVAPFILSGADPKSKVNAILCGFLIAALSVPRGQIREKYGTW